MTHEPDSRPSILSRSPDRSGYGEAWRPMHLFRALGETLTLIGFVSFGVSGLFNSLVFRAWHLDFFEIASPADVIMSGLDASGRALILLLSIFLPYVVGRWCLKYVYRQIDIHISDQMFTILLAGTSVVSMGLFSFLPGVAKVFNINSHVSFVFLVIQCIFISMFWLIVSIYYDLKLRDPGSNPEDSYTEIKIGHNPLLRIEGMQLVIFLAFIAIYIRIFISDTSRLLEEGYLHAEFRVVNSPSTCAGRVMWMGERAVVVACGPPPHPHFAIISTLNAPGLTITDVPPPHPPAA